MLVHAKRRRAFGCNLETERMSEPQPDSGVWREGIEIRSGRRDRQHCDHLDAVTVSSVDDRIWEAMRQPPLHGIQLSAEIATETGATLIEAGSGCVGPRQGRAALFQRQMSPGQKRLPYILPGHALSAARVDVSNASFDLGLLVGYERLDGIGQ